jgi:glycogen debranching enzyme
MGEEIAAKSIELAEPSLLSGQSLHVLKHDDLFAVFNDRGDFHGTLHPVGPSTGADGLFQDDTRILSAFTLSIAGRMPQVLGAGIGRDNVLFTAHLANPQMRADDGTPIDSGRIAIHRRRFLWRRKLYEAVQVESFLPHAVATSLVFEADADFCDVFEIRGATRARRGKLLDPVAGENALLLAYRGLDGQMRKTGIAFSVPVIVQGTRITLPLTLAPGDRQGFLLSISSEGDILPPSAMSFLSALKRSKHSARRALRDLKPISTSNAAFDAWLHRAAADLSLLITELDTGPYPYAGIPWFSAPFGRDAVVTAMQVLWVDPSLARGVLAYLSSLQAADRSAFHDSEPGKIMHELRKGEMAALLEVPFGRYYGGVDTTPLFVMLAGAYLRRTGDVEFIRRVWPAVKAALAWMDEFGDQDGDGFIEYRRGLESGLSNQGWKDSSDSVFHAGGDLASGAIAMVEVQAYAVAAKEAASAMAAAIGDPGVAATLARQAAALRQKVDASFWSEEIGTYALALDGMKRPCVVRASNAGHVLFCGVAKPERAARVGRDLMSRELFSGWGVRTVAEGESRYNPMSYHNGTVWPHDCSIVAAGLARYGMNEEAGRILSGLFDAARNLTAFRMPELFCGFPRRAGEAPVCFPSACTPQAWASGAVFLLLQACLGVDIDAAARIVHVRKPFLPEWLEHVSVSQLAVGEGRASLHFSRASDEVRVGISDTKGDIRLVVSGAETAI